MELLMLNLKVAFAIFFFILALVFADACFAKGVDEKGLNEVCEKMAKPKELKLCKAMVSAWQVDIDTLEATQADHGQCLQDLAKATMRFKDGGEK